MGMYKHKGTEIYTGARSINFRTFTRPIPTVLFVHGNKCKRKHAYQDSTPICGICRVKGHFRDDCPQLPLIQSYLDLDHDMRENQKHQRSNHGPRLTNMSRTEKNTHKGSIGKQSYKPWKKKDAELEEKENRRMLLKKRYHVQRSFQQNDSD